MLDIAELEELVAAQMAEARVPGLALALVRDGALAYARRLRGDECGGWRRLRDP